MSNIECRECDTVLPETMFYKTSCGRYYDRKCKNCKLIENNRRRATFKQKCIEYKGGACVVCGYNKCSAALEFHHLDPKEKEFEIARKSGRGSIDTVKNELDKCVLVCRNCHAEIHAGLDLLIT